MSSEEKIEDMNENSSNNKNPYGYVFGYGSIINLRSRVRSGGSANAVYVRISEKFGYRRKWNFRSPTGFTALGLSKVKRKENRSTVNGVLFACSMEQMKSFDERESGYLRVRIPVDLVEILDETKHTKLIAEVPIYVYVPPLDMCSRASEKYPICQTYIDCVMSGLLDVGGKPAVNEFIRSTFDWTSFYLYDTPMSRRPWLHRGDQYKQIDEILEMNDSVTMFRERRHPPEYAHLCSLAIRGIWGVPSRNSMFYGREQLMSNIHKRLRRHQNTGIGTLVLAGLGGVGKTQLAIEYCHRQYASKAYSLVLWIRAESHATIARDFQSFATDFGIEQNDSVDDGRSFIRAVCKKLCNATTPWLIVFDNIGTDFDLSTCIPRGAQNGCVLCTSRVMLDKKPWQGNCLPMECFSLSESREFLKLATGSLNHKEFEMGGAADMLALDLGNLPLAVALAASKMRKCDIGCAEYLAAYRMQRLAFFEHGASLQNYAPRGIAGTFAISLQWIENESETCRLLLNSLCFLSPDSITRCLVRELLKVLQESHHGKMKNTRKKKNTTIETKTSATSSSSSSSSSGNFFTQMLSFLFVPLCDQGAFIQCPHINSSTPTELTTPPRKEETKVRTNSWTPYVMSLEVQLETNLDKCWALLKSSCFLSVRSGRKSGSMHRLLQQLLRSKMMSEKNGSVDISIRRCVAACKNLWCFDSCDSSNWDKCGEIVMHIRTLANYVSSTLFTSTTRREISNDLADLLLFASEYESITRSRFDESLCLAVDSLRLASMEEKGPIESWRSSLKACSALCQIGKILRYQDRLELSCACVTRALNVLEKLKPCLENELELVSTLHELGLVQTKLKNLDSANRTLNRALDMKRHLQSVNKESRVNISSTLYALARVLSLCKPPQLERSKSLLLQSLEVERNTVARASTYQMLARVTIRQGVVGFRETAQRYLNEALRLHKSVYNTECHVNIASVRHQLGFLHFQSSSVSLSRNSPKRRRRNRSDSSDSDGDGDIDYVLAAENFESALRIRRRVYGNQPHFDISKSLHALGLLEIRRKNFGKAQAYLEEQMSCLKKLLRRCDAASPVLSTTWSPKLSPSHIPRSNNNKMDELDNFQLPPPSISTRSKKNEMAKKKRSPTFLDQDIKSRFGPLSEMLYKCGMTCSSMKNIKMSPYLGSTSSSMAVTSEESQSTANRILNSMIMCMESLRNIAKRQGKKCTAQHLNREIQMIRKHVRSDETFDEESTASSVVCRSIHPTVMVFCRTRSFVRSELIRARSDSSSGYSKWNEMLQNARIVLKREQEMGCPAETRVCRDVRKSLIDSMSLFLNQISLDKKVDMARYGIFLLESKRDLFSACDKLRATFRAHGYEINDA